MDPSDKLTEHYLTCIICAEVFTNPTTLHCDHTFCRPCLVKYTKTQPDALQAKSIPCPSCRQFTRVDSPEKPVEDWVNQVKPSRLIQGLMEDFGPGRDTNDQSTCDACRNEGENTPATSWCIECGESLCDNCARMHRRFSVTRAHEVTTLSGETKERKKTCYLCSEHKDEQVKLFCKDCNKAICHICCSISHRQCLSVVTLESVVAEVLATLEKKRNDLGKNIKSELQQLANQKENINKLTQNINTVEAEIKQASEDIQKEIKEKESKLLDDLAKLKGKHMEDLRADMKSREITLQGHRQQFEFIDLALKSESQMDMFAIYGSWGKSADHTVEEKDMPAVGKITFTQDNDKLMKAVSKLQLGEIHSVKDYNYRQDASQLRKELHHDKLDRNIDVNIGKKSVVLQDTIDCKVKGDQHSTSVFDVVVLNNPDGKIVIAADNNNNSIKAFYKLKSESYARVLKINTSPWQIAKVTYNEIAISGLHKLVFVQFHPDPFLTVTVDTEKRYDGFACLDSRQYVGGAHGSIDFLGSDGKVSKSIPQIIKTPRYIHASKKAGLLVSDSKTNSIVSLTIEGNVNFTYSPTGDNSLKYPRGITTTENGEILIADCNNNRVIQLTELGQFAKELITEQDGLVMPRGLCLDEDGMLYVASEQYVKVYKFE